VYKVLIMPFEYKEHAVFLLLIIYDWFMMASNDLITVTLELINPLCSPSSVAYFVLITSDKSF